MQKRNYLNSYKNRRLQKLGITEEEARATGAEVYPPPETFCCFSTAWPTVEHCEKELVELQKQEEKEREHLDVTSEKDLFFGTAFVIFNKQSSATKVLDKFEVSPLRRFLSFIWYKVFCQSKSKIDNTYFDGNRLEIERAPEPTDVFWGNLHVTTTTRIKTTFKTYFATLIVLGAVFGINLGINIWKSDLESSGGNNGAIRLLTIFMSFFVVFFNTLLGRVIRIFSAFEKHETYTKYNLSVAVKLTFAMFVNTALIPVLVNVNVEDWFTNAGLVVDAFYNLLSVCFFSPISYYFNPFYGIKLLRQRIEETKGADSKLT